MNKVEKDTRTSRLIFDAKIARKLLKMGHVVIDIKPNRENTDKTIFVFENTDEFKNTLSQIMDEMKAKSEAKKNAESTQEEYVQLKLDDSY